MGYLDLVRASQPSSNTAITAVHQYEINELDELSPDDETAPLYDQLKAIYARDDIDLPAMLAERSRINMEIHRMKYSDKAGAR